MTSGKIALVTVGIAGAVALGVAFGPRLVHHDDTTVAAAPAVEATAPVEEATTRPITKPRVKATPAESTTVAKGTRTIAPDVVKELPATQPELHARLKPVLNEGARMTVAAEGFKDGEQFAAVAHAARNTEIPFMLLKHRVLEEGKSLTEAIRDSRPDLDARHEALRAHDAARFDIAVISS
jgi:hypothetical protein